MAIPMSETPVSSQFLGRFRSVAHTALRIAAGSTFFVHGAQKLLGWFGGFGPNGTVDLLSRWGIAGTVESVAGCCIVLGLATRPLAFLASGEMAVTYFWMHTARTGHLWWWVNHGEVVLIYSFLWLYFAAVGAGPVSIDAWLQARRRRTAGP